VRAVKRGKIDEAFNPEKYGMIFCPDCRGSGKSFHNAKGASVCKACGGFGLIKKQEKSSIPDKNIPIELLK
jgi:DnaJ-class molecular chaperone